MTRNKKTYLKENRLADVIALLQVLAFDKYSHRTVDGLNIELQGKPKSATSWEEIAKEHPEFFRVKNVKDEDEIEETPKISLISRHVKLASDIKQSEILSPDLAKIFFETAIELYDIQKERSQRLFLWLPLVIAVSSILISAGSSLYIQHVSNKNQNLLKYYEVELQPKQENYTNFMKNITRAYYAAHSHSYQDYLKAKEESESSLYILEPFLTPTEREHVWNDYQQFLGLCSGLITKDSSLVDKDMTFQSYDLHKNQFRTYLNDALFEKNKSKRE